MINWVAALMIGLISGSLLYLCVRLRGKLVPIAILRFGQSSRLWVWLATILIMIVISNLSLIALRSGLSVIGPGQNTLPYEIGFAIISFTFALYLVRQRMCRDDCPLSASRQT